MVWVLVGVTGCVPRSTGLSLVTLFSLFVLIKDLKFGGLITTLRLALKCGGLESKFGRGPGPRDRRVMGWSYLCLGYKQSVCFGVPSWDTLVCESPCDMVRLGYGRAP